MIFPVIFVPYCSDKLITQVLPRAVGSAFVPAYPTLEIHSSREKAYVSFYGLLFNKRKWPNGEDGIHLYAWLTKEEIEFNSCGVNGFCIQR